MLENACGAFQQCISSWINAKPISDVAAAPAAAAAATDDDEGIASNAALETFPQEIVFNIFEYIGDEDVENFLNAFKSGK